MKNLRDTLPPSFLQEVPPEVLADEEGLQFEALEAILEEGNPVFRRYSGSSALEAEIELVCEWAGQYWYTSMSEELAGPFESLDAALAARDLLVVEAGTQEVDCEGWSAETLKQKLQVRAPEGQVIQIGGASFQITSAGTLVPAE